MVNLVEFKSRKQNGKNIFFIALSQKIKPTLVVGFFFCRRNQDVQVSIQPIYSEGEIPVTFLKVVLKYASDE